MAIGKRIEQRLEELGLNRSDLLNKLPDLTAQALSALIRRDSKRSEWDEKIADALGLSVLDLVYGRTSDAPSQPLVLSSKDRELLADISELLPEDATRFRTEIKTEAERARRYRKNAPAPLHAARGNPDLEAIVKQFSRDPASLTPEAIVLLQKQFDRAAKKSAPTRNVKTRKKTDRSGA